MQTLVLTHALIQETMQELDHRHVVWRWQFFVFQERLEVIPCVHMHMARDSS